MMPGAGARPLGPATLIITTDGSTLWATFSIEPVAAVWAVEPPVWASTGGDGTWSCELVQSAAPPRPAAPPTSRLAATTVAASPLPRSPLRGRRSGGRTGPMASWPEGGTVILRRGCVTVRRPGRGRGGRLLTPLVSVVRLTMAVRVVVS